MKGKNVPLDLFVFQNVDHKGGTSFETYISVLCSSTPSSVSVHYSEHLKSDN